MMGMGHSSTILMHHKFRAVNYLSPFGMNEYRVNHQVVVQVVELAKLKTIGLAWFSLVTLFLSDIGEVCDIQINRLNLVLAGDSGQNNPKFYWF